MQHFAVQNISAVTACVKYGLPEGEAAATSSGRGAGGHPDFTPGGWSSVAPARVNATMTGVAFTRLFVANNLIGRIGGFYGSMRPVEF